MALYEHVFLARQDLTQQQVDALVEQYKGVIESEWRVRRPGRELGTEVPHLPHQEEPQGLLHADGSRRPPAKALNEMERQMGLSEDVLRFLTVKVEAHEEGPSAMLQKRDRDDRGDRGFGDRDRGDRPRSFGDRDRGPRSFGDREGGGGGGDRGPRRPREAVEGSAE